MTTRALFTSGRALFALALLAATPAPGAAQRDSARVEIDHATGRARLVVSRGDAADTADLGPSPTVRLRTGVPVEVVVVNTNTALYRFSTETEATPLPELASLRAFGRAVAPYVADLGSGAVSARTRGAPAGDPAEREARVAAARAALELSREAVDAELTDINDALFGEGGLADYHTTALLALERMRDGVPPEEAARPLRRALGRGAACGAQAPVPLPVASDLLAAFRGLAESSHRLYADYTAAARLGEPDLSATLQSAQATTARARAALADLEPLAASVYRVERLVGLVAGACSRWSAGAARGSLTRGRVVTIHVEPQPLAESARLAARDARTFTVRVEPRPVVRIAVGLAAVAAPDARFPRYDTQAVPGGLQIFEAGRRDARFGLGVTLGLSWPGLDRREDRGVALWLPELLVTTSGGTGFGAGAALSWRVLKVGVGAVWLKHTELVDAAPGDVVETSSGLPLVETYRDPKLYIALSVFDWDPVAGLLPR